MTYMHAAVGLASRLLVVAELSCSATQGLVLLPDHNLAYWDLIWPIGT